MGLPPENSTLLDRGHLALYLPENSTDAVPFIYAEKFAPTLESCSAFFAEWCITLSSATPSHVVITLVESIRTHVVSPMQFLVSQLRNTDRWDLLQPECDEWREALPSLFKLARAFLGRNLKSEFRSTFDYLQTELSKVRHDSRVGSILLHCWRDLMRVFASQVLAALTSRIRDEFHAGFFIAPVPGLCDNTPPFQRYRIDCDTKPGFLSIEAAESILFAFHVADCSSIVSTERVSVVSEEDVWSVFQNCANQPDRTTLILDGATLRWRRRAAAALSGIIPLNKVRNGLARLRQLLLMGNELVWRAFFDELRERISAVTFDGMDEVHRNQMQRLINSILASVYTEYGDELIMGVPGLEREDTECDIGLPLRLTISESGLVTGEYTLNKEEGSMLSTSMPRFCQLFSIAFNVRRAGFELSQTYVVLARLSQQARKTDEAPVNRFAHAMSLIRSRMALVMNSLDLYFQSAVVQPKYEALDSVFESVQDRDSNTASGSSLVERFTSAQLECWKVLALQCMLDEPRVMKRYWQLFKSCMGFCELLQFDGEVTAEILDTRLQEAEEEEQLFIRNVALLARLLQRNRSYGLCTIGSDLIRTLLEVATSSTRTYRS